MHSTDTHVDILKTHLSVNGISGILPQNLSPSLLHIISKEYDDFKGDDKEKGDGSLSVLLIVVLILIKGEETKFDNIKSIEISSDKLFTYVNSYGVSITLEELRRSGLIDIPTGSLPTVDNIFDENSDLIVTGNYKAIQDFLNQFKN